MNSALASYSAAKQALADGLGATEDLLHLHAGLLIFFVSAFFALANEAVDLLTPRTADNPWEPFVDILNTVLWPTLLFLLARRRARADDPDRTG